MFLLFGACLTLFAIDAKKRKQFLIKLKNLETKVSPNLTFVRRETKNKKEQKRRSSISKTNFKNFAIKN